MALGDIGLHFAWQAVALGDIDVYSAWQAWHSAFTSRSRRGTQRRWAGSWWRAWVPVDAVDAAAVCVAGIALGDIDVHSAWQTWNLATSMCILRGMPGTYGTGQALVARLGSS